MFGGWKTEKYSPNGVLMVIYHDRKQQKSPSTNTSFQGGAVLALGGVDNFPQTHMSHEKNPLTFHYTGWLIAILIMAYYNP